MPHTKFKTGSNARANGVKPIRRSLNAGAITALSVLTCLLSLQVFVLAAGDSRNAAQFFYHAALRMQLHHLVGVPIETPWRIPQNLQFYSPIEVFAAIARELPSLIRGSTPTAFVVFSASTVCIVLALAISWFKHRQAGSFLVYLLVPAGVLGWYMLFANHTVIHAWVMVRLMVFVPICSLLALAHWLWPAAWCEAKS